MFNTQDLSNHRRQCKGNLEILCLPAAHLKLGDRPEALTLRRVSGVEVYKGHEARLTLAQVNPLNPASSPRRHHLPRHHVHMGKSYKPTQEQE